MRLDVRFPMEFINFVGDLEVTPKNMIIENSLDKDLEFVSRYFTPRPSIGELSRKILEAIHAREVRTSSRKLGQGSLGRLILDSDLLKVHPNLTKYMRVILLEVLALDIAINHLPELGEYINKKDINRVRENIKYSMDIISVDPRFVSEYANLSELYISLGYIEAQVEVIKRDLEGRLDG